MAGVIAILRKALEQIGGQQAYMRWDSDSGELDRLAMINLAREALADAARLSQDCLRADNRAVQGGTCSDEHAQYTRMCD
jgi:hypothetical protein